MRLKPARNRSLPVTQQLVEFGVVRQGADDVELGDMVPDGKQPFGAPKSHHYHGEITEIAYASVGMDQTETTLRAAV